MARFVEQFSTKGRPLNEVDVYSKDGRKVAEVLLPQEELRSERGTLIQRKRIGTAIYVNGRLTKNIKNDTQPFTKAFYLERIEPKYKADLEAVFKRYPDASVTEYLAI